jgi:CrcB protein
MKLLLLACAGGAIGAGARYLVNMAFASRGLAAFPWATLTVNVVGSFLMGIVMQVIAERLNGAPEVRTFVATGILGGLTTFSAFSYETFQLATSDGGILSARAAAYVAVSVALSLAALVAGVVAAREWL